MAYDSALWDGTTTGHAATTTIWSAPYSSAEFSDIFWKLLGAYSDKGFVLPVSYTNYLAITPNSPVAMSVLVGTGIIYIWGHILESTAQTTLTISTADATNPRLDRIVARLNLTAQTWELAVITGTAAATPSLPALTQNATTFEIAIGYVWVAAAVASIAATEIHDERIFAANYDSLANSLMQTNLLSNSEFMAASTLRPAVTGLAAIVAAPDTWELEGTPSAVAHATRPSVMSRGRYLQYTADAADEGISQTIPVRASTVYAIKFVMNVTAGDVGKIQVTTNSGAPATITRNIRRTGADIVGYIYYTTESDATTLTVKLLCANNTDVVKFGQTLVIEGFLVGPFRQIRETIPFAYNVGDTAWDGDVYAAGDTTVDLDSTFGGIILDGTRGVTFKIVFSDSSSAADAGDLLFTIVSATSGSNNSGVVANVSGLVNSKQMYAVGTIQLPLSKQLIFSHDAAGVTTVPTARIVGIVV